MDVNRSFSTKKEGGSLMAGANRVPGLRWSLTTQGRRAIASSALPNFCHRSQTKQNALLNDARALQISSISLIAPLAVSLALSGCTTGQAPLASSEGPPPSAGVSIGQRDLTP